MGGSNKGENWAAIATVLVIAALFFAGGALLGLSVSVLLILLAATAIVTLAIFILS